MKWCFSIFFLTKKKRFHKTVNTKTVTMFFHNFFFIVVYFFYYIFSIGYKTQYAKTKFQNAATKDFSLLARNEYNTL